MAIKPSLPEHVFDRIPVVLLGGVNLVRSLGLAGIPAIVASPKEDEPGFASRYCSARCLLPPYSLGDAAADALVAIGERLLTQYGRRVPLFYGGDDGLKLIYANRERLQRYFLLLLNDEQVARAMLSKDGFQEFAQRRGLPVPAALHWEGTGASSVAGHAGPVVVKPSNKDGWSDSHLRKRAFGRAKALVFPSGADAAADTVLAHFRDQLTVQEYVSGDDTCNWSFHGFADEKGHVLHSFVGHKLRTCPPDNGESAYIELAANEELRALGTRLAACLPLKGIFKMDFKRDARTGRWYLLEVNARFNLWQYLGAANGINLMQTAYDYLLEGKRPGQTGYFTDKRWLSLELDARAFRDLRREGKLSLAGWLASLAASRKVYNLFAWSDPGPWASFWARRMTRLGTRAPARFLTMVRQWRSTAS
jgi:predicted ATP-grasp superfamily ATP-dependent carboligase